MWAGPYGEWGSRKYMLASLDQSLKRMGLDYVDIFYSHRFDPDTPLEETMGALDTACAAGARSTRASPTTSRSRRARPPKILRDLGTPCLIHQPSYSMFNRWVEDGLLDVLDEDGHRRDLLLAAAQGLLTEQIPRRRHPRGLPGCETPGFLRPDTSPKRSWPRSASSTTSPRRAGRRWRSWRSRLGAATSRP